MTDPNIILVVKIVMGSIFQMFVFGALAWYRVHRKFKNEPVKSWKDRLERNWIEAVATMILIPELWKFVATWIEALT